MIGSEHHGTVLEQGAAQQGTGDVGREGSAANGGRRGLGTGDTVSDIPRQRVRLGAQRVGGARGQQPRHR
ncbi:hypothetical protein ABZ953_38710, partial [Streptomyces sp. NPDC046465]|uniref:hypothetical protein n=1 Tax=Streptomyces sp. NPDC046465 TaxID=3155810 RepID=UPI0033F91FDD